MHYIRNKHFILEKKENKTVEVIPQKISCWKVFKPLKKSCAALLCWLYCFIKLYSFLFFLTTDELYIFWQKYLI